MSAAGSSVTREVIENNWRLTGVRLGETLRIFDGRVTGILESDQGRFVYKLIPGPPENSEPGARVLEFLEQRSFGHAPKLLRAQQGQRTVAVDRASLTVMEYVEGSEPAPTPANYRQLGRIMGELNCIAEFPLACPITLNAVRPAWPELAAYLKSQADRDEFIDVASGLPDLDALPKALIHFGMDLGDAIQRPDGTIVAVDWDAAGMGTRVFDPGGGLISGFLTEDLAFDEDGAREFYAGYRSRVQLSDAETAAVFDASLFYALRYVRWANPEVRLRRIRWAIEHRARLESVL
jgi:YD repeat-containing protein